jgi:hypothetical protein
MTFLNRSRHVYRAATRDSTGHLRLDLVRFAAACRTAAANMATAFVGWLGAHGESVATSGGIRRACWP